MLRMLLDGGQDDQSLPLAIAAFESSFPEMSFICNNGSVLRSGIKIFRRNITQLI